MNLERRCEERLDAIAAAERMWHTDVAGEHRSRREQDQRNGHRPGRFVRIAMSVAVAMTVATGIRVLPAKAGSHGS